MGKTKINYESLVIEQAADDFAILSSRPISSPQPPMAALSNGVATGCLHGFDLDGRPLVSGLAQLPGEVLAARTTVQLMQQMIGESVVVLYEQGDPHLPIIIGVMQQPAPQPDAAQEAQRLSVQADGDSYVVSAEREIVLRCGDASITLTRAGKVIIKGNYIVSRSTGYNKIKGAAIDIN